VLCHWCKYGLVSAALSALSACGVWCGLASLPSRVSHLPGTLHSVLWQSLESAPALVSRNRLVLWFCNVSVCLGCCVVAVLVYVRYFFIDCLFVLLYQAPLFLAVCYCARSLARSLALSFFFIYLCVCVWVEPGGGCAVRAARAPWALICCRNSVCTYIYRYVPWAERCALRLRLLGRLRRARYFFLFVAVV
jgi:hypothetical protein